MTIEVILFFNASWCHLCQVTFILRHSLWGLALSSKFGWLWLCKVLFFCWYNVAPLHWVQGLLVVVIVFSFRLFRRVLILYHFTCLLRRVMKLTCFLFSKVIPQVFHSFRTWDVFTHILILPWCVVSEKWAEWKRILSQLQGAEENHWVAHPIPYSGYSPFTVF